METMPPRAALIDDLRHFGIGYSWGGYESLVLPIDPRPVRSATDWATPGPMIPAADRASRIPKT